MRCCKILNRNRRTPNEIVLLETHAEIILYDKNNIEFSRALIDIEDVEEAKKYKWYLTRGYVRNHKSRLFLHHLILYKPDSGYVVDHINRNRLDCRKNNLRIVDYQTNGINKGKQSNNTSGHPGVSWSKERQKWEAHIKLDGRKINLGRYLSLQEAVEVRLRAELKHFGHIVDRKNDKYTVFKNCN